MTTNNLIDNFIKVWLGDLPNHERVDAINALNNIIDSVIKDIQQIAKDTLRIPKDESKS